MIQTKRNLPKDILLGILRTYGIDQMSESRQIAGWSSTRDSLVECHHITGDHSSARGSGETDPLRIHFGATGQIIDCAHRIPDAITSCVASDED